MSASIFIARDELFKYQKLSKQLKAHSIGVKESEVGYWFITSTRSVAYVIGILQLHCICFGLKAVSRAGLGKWRGEKQTPARNSRQTITIKKA